MKPLGLGIAICTGMLLATPSFAQADSTNGPAAAAQPPDRGLEVLLRKAERQIADGHGLIPLSDNALDTWQQAITAAFPATPDAIQAMTRFADSARSRAAREMAAGRDQVASDYTMFASLAENYVVHAEGGGVPEEPSAPALASLAKAIATAQGLDTPAVVAPSPDVPVVTASAPAPPEPTAPAPTPPAPTPPALVQAAPPAQAETPPAQDPAMAAVYAGRGDDMMAVKDITAARRFYRLAASAGSARAAMALARTYDPASLAQLGVIGLLPDPDLAATWYGRAAALGDQDAGAQRGKLKLQAAQ